MWRKSVRVQLLAGLLFPLVAVALLQLWVAYNSATAIAQTVTDRLLLASARSIAEKISFDEGRVESQVPPSALGMFDLGYGDIVFYRITTSDGRLLAGYPDLAPPTPEEPTERPRYFNDRYNGYPIRLVTISQPIPTPTTTLRGFVIVAQTLHGQSAMRTLLWIQNSGQQALLVFVALAVAWFLLRRGLSPILCLSDEVDVRHPTDYEPFNVAALQTELRPLLRALNGYMLRLRTQSEAQRRFTANAAHQLRTPLTLLKTQASYGLRGSDSERLEAIRAILGTSEGLVRLTNQLLSLARSERRPAVVLREDVDLSVAVREILEEYAPLAVARNLDLSFEVKSRSATIVRVDPAQLRDLIVNLIDNAIRYTPAPGHIEVVVSAEPGGSCSICIKDTGPGIPLAARALVFERFYRLREGQTEGSGLGLAIVKEIVDSHGAAIELRQRVPGPGFVVEVRFDCPQEAAPG